ncbi:MAG TPA: thioesterase family protein [Candidatus Binatia bacterium]|nr:thioesterase family protein [Candidatus Binatia bacterium]
MTEHVEHMRVAWVDTDASGLIHYTAALRWFEVAEHALLRRLFAAGGLPSERTFFFPRVHVEADYKAALHYPDEFECRARVAAIGRSSATFAYEVRRTDGVVAIVGRIVAVTTDLGGQPIPLPEGFRATLAAAL